MKLSLTKVRFQLMRMLFTEHALQLHNNSSILLLFLTSPKIDNIAVFVNIYYQSLLFKHYMNSK